MWELLPFLGQGLMGLANWWMGNEAQKEAEKHKPKTPKIEPFHPYYQPFNPEPMQKLLESYGQQQRKKIYENAAARGTYYGAGGTMPGEIQLAQTQQQALAQAQMQYEKLKQLAIQQQYLKWLGQKYGLQSAEYQNEWNDYMKRLQAAWQGTASAGQGLGSFMGTMLPYLSQNNWSSSSNEDLQNWLKLLSEYNQTYNASAGEQT